MLNHITSHAVLQRQSTMTLKERVSDIHRHYGVHTSVAGLSRYYKERRVKFGRVNLASINKLKNADSIR